MRRVLRSWSLLVVALVILAGGVGFGLAQLQKQTSERAHRGVIENAHVIATLVVRANQDLAGGVEFSSNAHSEMDREVALLLSQDRLLGLEVWRDDGHLLYADPNHPSTELTLPTHELTRMRQGKEWIETSPVESGRGQATLDIFLPWDTNADGSTEGAVEILLPQDTIAASIRRTTDALNVGAAALLIFLVTGMLIFRRRLLTREHEGRHDSLTGLLNRAALRAEVGRAALSSRAEDGRWSALLMLDLDGFKAVNDTLGHPAGDTLLSQVGVTLRASVRQGDAVSRLGGDEFAVLLTELPSAAKGEELARQLLDRLRGGSYTVHGIELAVDASIGVVVVPDHGTDVDLLLQRADVAMYQAKRTEISVQVYDEATDTHDVSQLGILVELRRAIDLDELVLHYQPKAAMGSGEIVGVEALVRWQHPTRGLLGPNEFIALAENTGLMHPLTRWVLARAIRQAASWRDQGLMLAVAVNISPRSLLDGHLPALVLELLAEARLPAHLLEIEITETAIMTDPERAITVLKHLQAMGIRVSIDDFGTGYTSLAYLKELPVQTLKIDRAFIAELCTSASDEAITESVIGLGHKLGLTVLAEGIETDEVWQRLRAMSCDEGQGYLLARPLPAEELTSWVVAHVIGEPLNTN